MIEQNTGLGKRRPPCAYQITPELQLRVAMWPSATGQDDLYRISAYACGIGSIAPCETDGNLHQAPRKNCVIPGSRHFKASIALDAIPSWLEHVYVRLITEAVYGSYKDYVIAHRQVSLKTVLIARAWETEGCTDDVVNAYWRFARDPIGCRMMDTITENDITDVVKSVAKGNTYNQLVSVLFRIWEKSVADRICAVNIFASLFESVSYAAAKAEKATRDATARRSMARDETRSFLEMLSVVEKNNDHAYLVPGILIKLYTGLRSEEVCALSWSDYRMAEHFGFHVLQVYRELSRYGDEMSIVGRLTQIRTVPCVKLLADVLDPLLSRLRRYYSEDMVREMPIIAKGDNPFRRVDPTELATGANEIACFLFHGEGEDRFSVGGKQGMDPNKFKGDFLRNHFRFVCRYYGKMDDDEVAYLLGIKPDTVDAIHYIDFSKSGSLNQLYQKLMRCEAMLVEDAPKPNWHPASLPQDNAPHTEDFRGGIPGYLELIIDSPNQGTGELVVKAANGVDVERIQEGKA